MPNPDIKMSPTSVPALRAMLAKLQTFRENVDDLIVDAIIEGIAPADLSSELDHASSRIVDLMNTQPMSDMVDL